MPRLPFWTHARDEKLTRLAHAGTDIEAMAIAMSEFGNMLTTKTIVARLKLLGVRVVGPNYYWTPERNAQLRKLWEQEPHLKLIAIKQAMGGERSEATISKQAHALGLTPRHFYPAQKYSATVPVAPKRQRSRAGEFQVAEAGKNLHTVEAPRVKAPPPLETPCPFYHPMEAEAPCGVMVNRRPGELGIVPGPYCEKHKPRVMPMGKGPIGAHANALGQVKTSRRFA